MASLNQASIIGLLGADPKISTTRDGKKMATFSVATTEKGFTASNGTVIPDRTEWHNIVLWGRVAEVAEKFLHKGSSVFVQGKIRTRSYEKDGIKKYITEIEGETMQMLDRPATSAQPQAPADTAGGYGYPPASIPSKDELGGDLPF